MWHTKNSLPLLTPVVGPLAHRAIRNRIIETQGASVHKIGGIETHVHIAVTVPPNLLLSDWIGRLKGGSSHDVNQQSESRDKQLQWQSGYGVVSFGTKDLPWVVDYIKNQRQHHDSGTAAERLEQITHDEDHG